MKRLSLLFILPVALLFGCIGSDGPDHECDRDSDCASWQECAGNYCESKPDEPAPKSPPGTTVTDCNCSTTNRFPGQTRADSRCSSSVSMILVCSGCCATDAFGNCLGVPWAEVCQ